jgi:hypothetical protein
MNKIIVRIKGGLGNQLFCYAAARRLAFVNNIDLVIDDETGFVRDQQYKRKYALNHFSIPIRKATLLERLEPFERYRRGLKKIISRHRSYNHRSYIEQEGNDFDSRLLAVKPRGSLYLDGYWQSEQYFKDIESTIREDLIFIPPNDDLNIVLAEQIKSKLAVAVHVRFFDTPHEKGIINASTDYYERAILKMDSFVPNAHYFVFSDQPDAARALIPLSENRVTLVSHNHGDDNAYADLWLMTQCQHFIIANSTFSWWGAWLASNADKQIIAPGFMREGVMSWGFKGLLPDAWVKL